MGTAAESPWSPPPPSSSGPAQPAARVWPGRPWDREVDSGVGRQGGGRAQASVEDLSQRLTWRKRTTVVCKGISINTISSNQSRTRGLNHLPLNSGFRSGTNNLAAKLLCHLLSESLRFTTTYFLTKPRPLPERPSPMPSPPSVLWFNIDSWPKIQLESVGFTTRDFFLALASVLWDLSSPTRD